MDARYFRLLFQNVNDGIVHSGCLWNTYTDYRTDFMYLSGNSLAETKKKRPDSRFSGDTHDLHFVVYSDFSYPYTVRFLEMLYQRKVHKVILPYLTPMQRNHLIDRFSQHTYLKKEIELFLKSPYYFLKEAGVDSVYQLLGNGKRITDELLPEGDYFEPVSRQERAYINHIEESTVPVYKAGYMMYNDWLFYFGNYRNGISVKEMPTVVMYHGTYRDSPEHEDCFMTIKPFSKNNHCKSRISSTMDTCELKCYYRNDYDLLKKHNGVNREDYITGTFLPGMAGLKENMNDIYRRFGPVRKKIRTAALPGGGSEEYWDKRILGFGMDYHRNFWIAPNSDRLSSDVIREISVSSPYNRFSATDEYHGLCMSGFLKNRADIEGNEK